MGESWDEIVKKIMFLTGPPVLFGMVGAGTAYMFEWMNDQMWHQKRWVIPTGGALVGVTIGFVFGFKKSGLASVF